MKKLLYIIPALVLAFTACNIDEFPDNSVSPETLSTIAGAKTLTNGTYAMFKASILEDASGMGGDGHSFIRHYQQASTLKADNVLPSGPNFRYTDLNEKENDTDLYYLWFIGYKICASASIAIDVIPDDIDDPQMLHMKGENHFLRAVAHMYLAQIFSTPYTFGREKPGIILQDGHQSEIRRATVGEIYDFIEDDLNKAITLMSTGEKRGNNAYASKEAAQALLARLYLYEGRDQECIDMIDELLAGDDPASKLDPDYCHLFKYAQEVEEVIWCVGVTDSTSDFYGNWSMLGAMYWSDGAPGDTSGWGEFYYSQPLLDLFWRYPQDQRLTKMMGRYGESKTGKKMIYWPLYSEKDDFRYNHVDREPTYDSASGKYSTTDENGVRHVVETELVNTYPRTYIMLNGEKQYVAIIDSTGCRTGAGNNCYPISYCRKFSNQNDVPSQICSPAYIRWGEVLLERAEANAHLGNVQAALNDVNVIRRRAGLAGEPEFTIANMAERGYNDIVDVVLDERRLETYYEGYRLLDLQRNKRDIDRRFAGRQPWELVKYNDPRLTYYIPLQEIQTTGIEQNLKY